MFETRIFKVHPTKRTFRTSLMCDGIPSLIGDTSDAYLRAHLHAAQVAATGTIAHVTKDNSGNEHFGFGPSAITIPSSILLKILKTGVHAYFDFTTKCWHPLPTEEAAVENQLLLSA